MDEIGERLRFLATTKPLQLSHRLLVLMQRLRKRSAAGFTAVEAVNADEAISILEARSEVGRYVAAERVQLGLELRVEHIANHRHARRPLRHSAEIGVAELGHPAAFAPERGEHDMDCGGRHRMLLHHLLNQIAVGY
jgi:hypothetical protein